MRALFALLPAPLQIEISPRWAPSQAAAEPQGGAAAVTASWRLAPNDKAKKDVPFVREQSRSSFSLVILGRNETTQIADPNLSRKQRECRAGATPVRSVYGSVAWRASGGWCVWGPRGAGASPAARVAGRWRAACALTRLNTAATLPPLQSS